MDNLWHQVLRRENYEPLEPEEATAVAEEATAVLSRPPASGRLSLTDRRAQYTDIGYQVTMRGWDAEPPIRPIPDAGDLTINQLQAILQRAITSGSRYMTVRTPPTSTPNQSDSEALSRIRDRLRRRRTGEDA